MPLCLGADRCCVSGVVGFPEGVWSLCCLFGFGWCCLWILHLDDVVIFWEVCC